MPRNLHIPDPDLLMLADGELSPRKTSKIHRHLAACGMCRTRMNEMEGSIADFVQAHHASLDTRLPPHQISRALLRVRLAELAAERPAAAWRHHLSFVFTRTGLLYASGALAFFLILGASILQSRRDTPGEAYQPEQLLLPNRGLTPGATRPVAETDLCTPAGPSRAPAIALTTARYVFGEYGIDDPQPRGYELDYLIDPELGGSGDPRNLWPQPYSIVWNARIKDALEDRLHDLVCSNQLTLSAAQDEISTNWIAAYKKHFHTDAPIADHLAFIKDEPWSY